MLPAVTCLQTSARIVEVLFPPDAADVSTMWPWYVVAVPTVPFEPVYSMFVFA